MILPDGVWWESGWDGGMEESNKFKIVDKVDKVRCLINFVNISNLFYPISTNSISNTRSWPAKK
jgi:hypothetical protein